MVPKRFDVAVVHAQLQYTGVIETVRIRASGYSYRCASNVTIGYGGYL